MCGRYASFLPVEALASLFSTRNPLPNLAASWNVAPTQSAAVIRRHPESGERHLDLLQWGLVPHFTRDLKAARCPINARSETAAGSAMFRGALTSRRCLVPANASYEWQTVTGGKQPYAIARRDGTALAFAGLWAGWRSPKGETLRSFTILTTAANATMQRLHKRMPVVLEAATWPAWLGEVDGDPCALMHPAADEVLHLWPVSRLVNNVRHNGAALLNRIDNPKPPLPSTAPAGPNPA